MVPKELPVVGKGAFAPCHCAVCGGGVGGAHMHAHMPEVLLVESLVLFFPSLPMLFTKAGSLSEPGIHCFDKSACPRVSLSTSRALDYRSCYTFPAFCSGVRDSNSGLHTCPVSAPSMQPSPEPSSSSFFVPPSFSS